jgi:hypothetical protein|tara:strand:+ start:973 stop:1203 length:231 start_codon:yes stop_codon:yes gene_type:complete
MIENVFNKVTGFLTGLGGLLMAFLPLTILWQVLTGETVFGMDVIGNLTNLIASIGEGGFAGLVVLILVVSFFTDKK